MTLVRNVQRSKWLLVKYLKVDITLDRKLRKSTFRNEIKPKCQMVEMTFVQRSCRISLGTKYPKFEMASARNVQILMKYLKVEITKDRKLRRTKWHKTEKSKVRNSIGTKFPKVVMTKWNEQSPNRLLVKYLKVKITGWKSPKVEIILYQKVRKFEMTLVRNVQRSKVEMS